MRNKHSFRFLKKRLLPLVGCVAIAVALVGPAGADVTTSFRHLWVDHLRPRLADAGTINDPANPLDWTRLKNVPSTLADGEDNKPVVHVRNAPRSTVDDPRDITFFASFPKGTFLLEGVFEIDRLSMGDTESGHCELKTSTTLDSRGFRSPPVGSVSVSLRSVAVFNTPATVAVKCSVTGEDPYYVEGRLTATEIESFTKSTMWRQ